MYAGDEFYGDDVTSGSDEGCGKWGCHDCYPGEDDEPTCVECGEVLPFDRVDDHSFCATCEPLSCDGCNVFVANGHGHYPDGMFGRRVCADCASTHKEEA